MARARWDGRRYATLAALLVLVGAGTAATISSCGSGGGGGSNGELCDQCGVTDGPCLTSVTVSGDDAAFFCPGQASCAVALQCFRELDSAQRRCYPQDARFKDFKCDGKRANRNTATPTASPTPTATMSVTPSATALTPTPTPSFTPSPTPTSTPFCGNGVVDEGESCDGTDLDTEDCDSEDVFRCEGTPGGTLRCTAVCTFDTSGCTCGP